MALEASGLQRSAPGSGSTSASGSTDWSSRFGSLSADSLRPLGPAGAYSVCDAPSGRVLHRNWGLPGRGRQVAVLCCSGRLES